MAAGFLPVDPAHLLTGETALAKLAALLEDTRLPDASRATLRRILGAAWSRNTARIADAHDS